jgi:tetratricopeptide (TPR) repeat protein
MSRAAAPARKASALIEALVDLDRRKTLDDLALNRLAREAQALMKSDATGARAVLGGVASIEGNVERVREHYDAALRLSSRDSNVLAHYATALTKVGKMDDAFEAIMEVCERHPDDAAFLQDAIAIAVQGARFGESRSLYKRRNRLKPEGRSKDGAHMTAIAEAIDRGAFKERAAREVVQIAHEIRQSAGARYAGSAPVLVYGEPDRFGFDVHVHASPTAAADLNEALANRVVENDTLMDGLRLNFVPTFIGTRTHVGDTAGTA